MHLLLITTLTLVLATAGCISKPTTKLDLTLQSDHQSAAKVSITDKLVLEKNKSQVLVKSGQEEMKKSQKLIKPGIKDSNKDQTIEHKSNDDIATGQKLMNESKNNFITSFPNQTFLTP